MTEPIDRTGSTGPTGPTPTLGALAERGSPRGATAVLRQARRDVVRHERRRAVAGGLAVAAVLTGAVGATVYLAPEDEARPLGAGSGAPPPAGAPQTLSGITVEGHEGFDRIVLRFDVDEVEPVRRDMQATLPSSPECQDFDPLDQPGSGSASFAPYVSASATGDDGLVPGLADTPVAGDTTFVRDVTALCAADGYAWVATTLTEETIGDTSADASSEASRDDLPSGPPPPSPVIATCAGEGPGELYVDVYIDQNRPDGTCPPPPA